MASALLFANNAQSTLAGPITSTSTTVSMQAGAGVLFPVPASGQYFKLTFLDAATKSVREIVHVTNVSGDTFTIVRAQEGTTAAQWLAGDFAINQLTAGTMSYVLNALATQTNGFYEGTDTGNSANQLTVPTTTPAAPATLAAGQLYLLTKNGQTNSGGVSAQIGTATTATAVSYGDGTALVSGDWPAGATAWLVYTGGVLQFMGIARSPSTVTNITNSRISSATNGGLSLANGSQSINGNQATTLGWNQAAVSSNLYSYSNGYLTVKQAGWYQMTANVTVSANTSHMSYDTLSVQSEILFAHSGASPYGTSIDSRSASFQPSGAPNPGYAAINATVSTGPVILTAQDTISLQLLVNNLYQDVTNVVVNATSNMLVQFVNP